MKEKASDEKASENRDQGIVSEIAEILGGEELTIDPVNGDEIDPVEKWWNDIPQEPVPEKQKRQLEEIDVEVTTTTVKAEIPPLDLSGVATEAVPKRPGGIETADPLPGKRKELLEISALEETSDNVISERERERDLPFSDWEPVPLKRSSTGSATEGGSHDFEQIFSDLAETNPPKADRPDLIPLALLVEVGNESPKLTPPTLPEITAIEETKEHEAKPESKLPTEATREKKKKKKTPVMEPVPVEEAPSPDLPFLLKKKVEEKGEEKVAITEPGTLGASSAPVALLAEILAEEPTTPEQASAEAAGISLAEEEKATAPPEEEATTVAPGKASDIVPIDAVPLKKKSGCWTIFATLFFFGTILCVGTLAVAAVYTWSRLGDLEKKITSIVRTNLESQGIYFDYQSWRYQFPTGMVLDEVTVFDDASLERPLLKVSELGLNVDLPGLVQGSGDFCSGEVSLLNSTLILFEAGEQLAEIKGINAEMLVDQSKIEVARLSAIVGGVNLNLRGIATLPVSADDAPETDPPAGSVSEAVSKPLSLGLAGLKTLEPWLAITSREGNEPNLNLRFSMDLAEPDAISLNGTLHGSELTWRGIDLSSVLVAFSIVPETGEISFPSVQIGYEDGFLAGNVSIDPATKVLKIQQLQSSIDLVSLLSAYSSNLKEALQVIRFVDAPSIQISGEVPLNEPALADLKIKYEHSQGFFLKTGERELPLRDVRGNFTLNRGSVETNDAGANLFGGAVSISGATRLTDESHPFNGLIEVVGLPLEQAASFLGEEGTGMSGRLHLVFRGVGYSNVKKIRGGGTIRVDDASLPNFPMVGPVQKLIGKVIPAFSPTATGSLVGAYIIESGILVTNDLTVANGGAKVVTNGSVTLETMETKFTSKAMLETALGVATGVGEKAIVVEGSGPLREPVLRVVDFPVDFAGTALTEVLGTTPKSLGSIKEVLGEGDNSTVISGQIEEATGIKLAPEITDLFRSLLGKEKPVAEPVSAPEN